jgi:hypothetical protein
MKRGAALIVALALIACTQQPTDPRVERLRL